MPANTNNPKVIFGGPTGSDAIEAAIKLTKYNTGGDGLNDVVKITVYLTDLDDYDRVSEAYGAKFPGDPPARVCVEVSRLPGDVRVEMDAVAYLG